MKMRTRIRIIKVITILGVLFFIAALGVTMWARFFPRGTIEYERRKVIALTVWGIAFVIVVLLIILTSIGGKPEPKPIAKYDLLFGDALADLPKMGEETRRCVCAAFSGGNAERRHRANV